MVARNRPDRALFATDNHSRTPTTRLSRGHGPVVAAGGLVVHSLGPWRSGTSSNRNGASLLAGAESASNITVKTTSVQHALGG
jgi:hypothetical protein